MQEDLTVIPIQGYEGYYTISENGEVFRMAHVNKNGEVKPLEEPTKLKTTMNGGQVTVKLTVNCKDRNFRLSRLVWTHFRGKLNRN